MKLQRWVVSDEHRLGTDAEKDDSGRWCQSEDVDALEAENEQLRAEIERLRQSQKMLSAEEVTEPGWYWWSPADSGTIEIVEVDYEYTPGQQKRLVFLEVGKAVLFPLSGQFIGPLKAPEV